MEKPFERFDQGWALVTAGNLSHFNTMTISWGGLGTLWELPVATIYIKPCRYTHQFLETNDFFTVSFFTEEYRKDLTVLGSKSGRECDKLALTSLTPKVIGESVGFLEASETLLCKKIYQMDLKKEGMPLNVIQSYYKEEAPHTMYIGQVIREL